MSPLYVPYVDGEPFRRNLDFLCVLVLVVETFYRSLISRGCSLLGPDRFDPVLFFWRRQIARLMSAVVFPSHQSMLCVLKLIRVIFSVRVIAGFCALTSLAYI